MSPLIPIRDLFETHLTVTDLERAVTFYRDVLGLALATVIEQRRVAFFWIGEPGKSMLGLWETGSGPQRLSLHTAFTVELTDLLNAPGALLSAGITPLDLAGDPTTEPVVLTWMPAASLYFRDPDGNLLEYISMLPNQPQPDGAAVPWSVWTQQTGA